MRYYYSHPDYPTPLEEYRIRDLFPNTSFVFPLEDETCAQFNLTYIPDHKPEVYQSTPEDTQQIIVKGVQDSLDAFARTRNYEGILSACTYATSVIPKFSSEGQYCVNLRDNTWMALYRVLEQVKSGIRPMPSSIQDVINDLPVMEWPT